MIIGIIELPDSIETLAAPIQREISTEVSRKSLFLRATLLPNVTCIYNFPGLFTFINDQQTRGIYRCKRRSTDIPFCETPLIKILLHEARPNSPPFLHHRPRTSCVPNVRPRPPLSPLQFPGQEAKLVYRWGVTAGQLRVPWRRRRNAEISRESAPRRPRASPRT